MPRTWSAVFEKALPQSVGSPNVDRNVIVIEDVNPPLGNPVETIPAD